MIHEDTLKVLLQRCVEAARSQISKKRGPAKAEGARMAYTALRFRIRKEVETLGFDWKAEGWLYG